MSKREMTRRHKLGLAVLALATTVAAGTVFAQQRAISIATGGTGGVYYPLGGGLANVLSKTLPGIQATAEVTGGSVDNLKLINAGRASSRCRWSMPRSTPTRVRTSSRAPRSLSAR